MTFLNYFPMTKLLTDKIFFFFKGSTVAREASDKEKVMFLLKQNAVHIQCIHILTVLLLIFFIVILYQQSFEMIIFSL